MGELLPTWQANNLINGLTDYLKTTFALSDPKAQSSISEFLTHPDKGMFKGPYVRLRLPFEPAAVGWEDYLDFYDSKFPPYGHQANAFERLTTKSLSDGHPRRPQATLVTTGTGSGKTESFLYPILDHVLRAKRAGATGVKALILYPMNALANDQADRLAKMISGNAALSGVRAALYTGQQDEKRTKVSARGLITDRSTIRKDPPDILLTNYKMLDMLLLRHEDSKLWESSGTSLQYLVLDEFHTYDGAQGTDVAMLLRRLGLRLKSYWPTDLSDAPLGLTQADHDRPLGRITPVATSATLGGSGGAESMLSFAETIFGEKLSSDSLVTESRLSFESWRSLESANPQVIAYSPIDVASNLADAVAQIRNDDSQNSLVSAVLAALFSNPPTSDPRELLLALRHHPLTRRLVEHSAQVVSIHTLAESIFPALDADLASEFLSHVIALFSHVRALTDRSALSVETHLWVRELSRIEAALDTTHTYRWGDDGVVEDDEAESTRIYLPAIFCRHCGKNGWGAMMAPTETELDLDPDKIRQASLKNDSAFRPLIHAVNEAEEAWKSEREAQLAKDGGLRFFHLINKTLSADSPDMDDPDFRSGKIIPVQTHVGLEAKDHAGKSTCPSCMTEDSIRFVGSAVATLTSVAVTNLFGAKDLNLREKKALVFTDSVQDAAHRAGFIQARSHVFNLRTALSDALAQNLANNRATEISLQDLVQQSLATANASDNPSDRFKLVPPELVYRNDFQPFWDVKAQSTANTSTFVQRRLSFDASLEFGLRSRLGRTLVLTGTVAVEVNAGHQARLIQSARKIWDSKAHSFLPGLGVPTDQQLVAWVRGLVERIRIQGGIQHEWLTNYVQNDGHRFHIWGGRRRHEGMQAFPKGIAAPAFPVNGSTNPDNGLESVTSKTGWYVRWTSRMLGVSTDEASFLSRDLFEELADLGILNRTLTNVGARVYSLSPSRIMLSRPNDQDLADAKHTLRCATCRTDTFGSPKVIDQLDGAKCLQSKCAGTLERKAPTEVTNYYRTMYSQPDGKRVVSREHTSLLDDKIRLEYENAFKKVEQAADAPNVLVATPTLEMGIDIGDLSCVMLASMPGTVASYVQRVGRAGRLTGNSLALAFVRGRGEHLPKLYDPLSIINGDVKPPTTFLQAEEILARQFVAYLGDQLAIDMNAAHPTSAREALRSTTADSYLGQIIDLVKSNGIALCASFLGQFSTEHIGDTEQQQLAVWASQELPAKLETISIQWNRDREELKHRVTDIEKVLPELREELKRREHEFGADHVKVQEADRDLRSAEAQERRLRGEIAEASSQYWISAIEQYGLFPNYTLVGDSVTLDVGISYRDDETGLFKADSESFARSAGVAIQELAPGATFYAKGMEIKIDAVDLGANQREIQHWQLCPQCGWKNHVSKVPGVSETRYQGQEQSCPRCKTAGIEDVGNIYGVIKMRKVSAEIKRDESQISDRADERQRANFSTLAVADVNPEHIESSWFIEESGFGAEYLSSVELSWLNLGQRGRGGSTVTIAGQEITAPYFQLCEYCGKQDTNSRQNSQDEHRFWCRHRKSNEEHSTSVILARELKTQGVKLTLPASASDVDLFALPTLLASIMLGLQEHVGGTPGQIGIVTIPDAAASNPDHQALLIHDAVPGGTGYLASFKQPENVFATLAAALKKVSECSCGEEGRRACHQCLLPFAGYGQEDYVSRVEAQRILRELLDLHHEDELPEFSKWTVSKQRVERSNGESPLEISFRKILKKRLSTVNADVDSVPSGRGERLLFRIPGQSHRWILEPQVDVFEAGVRPDFVLSSENISLPKVAIFTDGKNFHASLQNNNLEGDALKRARLKSVGYVPWAITNADLDAFDTDSPNNSPNTNEWIHSKFFSMFKGKHSLAPDITSAMGNGSMELFWAWIMNPKLSWWEQFSNLAAGMAVGDAPNRGLVSEAELPEFQFDMDLVASPVLKGNQIWWTRETSSVHFIGCGHPTQTTDGVLPSMLCLDDSDSALRSEAFDQSWRQWLYWSNLLAFRSSFTSALIGTRKSREAILELAGIYADMNSEPNTDVSAESSGELIPADWANVLEELSDLDAEEFDFLKSVVGAGIRAPEEIGEEVSGSSTVISWTSDNFAIVYDEYSAIELRNAGWDAAVLGDMESVIDSLQNNTSKEV